MSSSTSSSSATSSPGPAAGAGDAGSPSSARRVHLKTFLAITLGMAISMVPIRLFTHLNDVSGETILARVLQAKAALPSIVAEENDLVMFFGSSMTHAGFSARQFDRELAERGVAVKSFNFGFGGLNPYFQDYLARRVRDAFDDGDRRLELALIELVPFQVTTHRFDGARSSIESFVPMLASPREMWEIARREPARGARMLTIHYLRDGISAEMLTHHFGSSLRPPRPRSSLPRDEDAAARRRELDEVLEQRFDEDYPDFAGERWYAGWQGAGPVPEERSESTLELVAELHEVLRTPRRMENDKLNRIHCCDIEELHFEEELIAAFVRMVKTFQHFSNRVEVILLPRNTDWIRYSPEAAERLHGLVERIERETDTPVRNFQQIDGIGPEMFRDTTHLSRYSGDVALTSFLVEEYGPGLGATAAPGTAD